MPPNVKMHHVKERIRDTEHQSSMRLGTEHRFVTFNVGENVLLRVLNVDRASDGNTTQIFSNIYRIICIVREGNEPK